MNWKKFIIYAIIIILILVAIFLSQQAYSKGIGKTLVSKISDQVQAYAAKNLSNVYPAITGEVQKRGDMIKNEVNQEQQKVSENIGQKISNYFSGVANSILHPGTPQNCQPVQTSTN